MASSRGESGGRIFCECLLSPYWFLGVAAALFGVYSPRAFLRQSNSIRGLSATARAVPWGDALNQFKPRPGRWLQGLGVHAFSPGAQRAILVALVSRQPVLLVGPHGAAKSHLASEIAAALGAPFMSYPADKISFDDLVGFIDPRSLADGELKYIPTGTALWTKSFILIDEVARASVGTQGKLNEVLWGGTLLGLPTKVRHAWAAMNPAEDGYYATPPDHAFLSRFVFLLEPPTIRTTKIPEARQIIGSWHRRERQEQTAWHEGTSEWLRRSIDDIDALVDEAIACDGERLTTYLVYLQRALDSQNSADGLLLDFRTFDQLHKALVVLRASMILFGECDISAKIKHLLEFAFPLLRLREGKVIPLPLGAAHEMAWRAAMGTGQASIGATSRIAAHSDPVDRLADEMSDGLEPIDGQAAGIFFQRLEQTLADKEADAEEQAAALYALGVALRGLHADPRWPADYKDLALDLEARYLSLRFGPAFEVARTLGISVAAMNADRPLALALGFMAGQIVPHELIATRRAPPRAYMRALAEMEHNRGSYRSKLERLVSALRPRLEYVPVNTAPRPTRRQP